MLGDALLAAPGHPAVSAHLRKHPSLAVLAPAYGDHIPRRPRGGHHRYLVGVRFTHEAPQLHRYPGPGPPVVAAEEAHAALQTRHDEAPRATAAHIQHCQLAAEVLATQRNC